VSDKATASDLGEELRARGMRLTTQRVRVLDAVRSAGHATADQIAAIVAADGGTPLPLSTVYRSLEALQEAGIVGHTHVDHRAPDYHLAEHATHIHLVCRGCGAVLETDVSTAEPLVEQIRTDTGFVADLTHAAVHGHCADCAASTPPSEQP
jgi:Fur family ferric uptake transcriptional regulator